MVEVTNAPILEGHTFPDKEIVLMRIVEEANLLFGVMGYRWMQGVSMVILSMLLLIMVPQHLRCLNHSRVTIITDEQKGLIEAMSDILLHAVNFFCSYHQRKNFIQHMKGGKGEYSCHLFYNRLLGCGRVETITKH